AGLRKEVQRNHRKLRGGSTLEEKNLVVVRDIHQGPQVPDGVLVDRSILLAAVAHLHNRHSRSLPVDKFVLRLLQYFKGQHSRPCREIITSAHSGSSGVFHLKSLLEAANVMVIHERAKSCAMDFEAAF